MNTESRTMITGFVDRILELRCSYQCTVDGVTVDVEEFFQLSKNHNTAWGRTSPRSGPPVGPVRLTVDGDTEHLNLIGAMVCNIEDIATQAPVLVAQDLVQAHVATAQVMYPKARAAHETIKTIVQGFDGGSAALTEWLFDVLKTLQARMPAPRTVEEAAPAPGQSVGADKVLADLVAPMGDNGVEVASALAAPPQGGQLWARWTATPEKLPAALVALARVGWLDVVKPRLEREAEEARKQQVPIRFPQPAGQTLTTGRTATIKSRKKNLAADETWADWTSCVTLALPGAQLALPLPSDVKIADGNTLQSVLTGGLLRTYLATWALWADNRSLLVEGGFAWDEETVIRRYLKKTGKVDGNLRAQVRADLARLCQIRVVKAGGWNVQGGSEPLISAYREDSSGRTVYVHAGVISLFLNDNFSQVPRNVLSLHPDDVSLALGLATLARSLAVAMLANNNRHEGTLKELAEACGADVVNGVRKHGPAAYWRRTFDDLCRVASDGGVGKVETVDAAEVPTEGARVRLTMSDEMVNAYRPLFEAANRRRSAEKALAVKGSRRPRKGSVLT